MTRDEAKKLLMVIQAAYPNFNPPDKSVAVDTWQLMLSDYSYAQVESAIRAYIRTDRKGFSPSIGQIIDRLQILYGDRDSEINEMAAWGMVLKAVRNSGYHSEEEYAKLPPVVQRAVVNPGQLKEWALMEDLDGTGLNVIQSNFMRTYRHEAEKAKEISKLSPDLMRLAQNRTETVGRLEQKMETIGNDSGDEAVRPSPELVEEKVRRAKERLGGLGGG